MSDTSIYSLQIDIAIKSVINESRLTSDNFIAKYRIAKARFIGGYILNEYFVQIKTEIMWREDEAYFGVEARAGASGNAGSWSAVIDAYNSRENNFIKIYNSYSLSHLYVYKEFSDDGDVEKSRVMCLWFDRGNKGSLLYTYAIHPRTGVSSKHQTTVGGSAFTNGWKIKTLGFQDVHGYLTLDVNRSNFALQVIIGNYDVQYTGSINDVTYFISTKDSVLCSNAGPNIWMSPDRMWIFFPPKWTTSNITYPKGLNSYYSGKAFIGVKGSTAIIPNDNSYLNTSHTSVIRSALSNVYVQEIIFNKTSDKMIVLTSSTSGCFGPADGSDTFDGDSHNPDRMFAFIYQTNTASWINVSSMVDKVNLMSSYNEGDSLKRPTMYAYPLTDNEGQYLFSFGKPAYSSNLTVFYTNTIW